MRFSVVITKYNYARFVGECVDSVLRQTAPAHEIIVVDDGSSDESLDILRRNYASHPRVSIISQHNQGQLMALANGIERATGDIICLLDADDRYKPEYIEEIEKTYSLHPETDLVFCRFELFGDSGVPNIPNPIWLDPRHDYDYGYTTVLTRLKVADWIGNVTSTLSLRARLAKMLELGRLATSWNHQIEADYCLLAGVSLMGGRKYHKFAALVEYRSHGTNHWLTGVPQPPDKKYRSMMNAEVCTGFFREKTHLQDDIFFKLDEECATIPAPLPSHKRAYWKAKLKFAYAHGHVRDRFRALKTAERKLRNWRRRMASRLKTFFK
jgi:glycosyltransferase involved in cell wall biosynthesis